MEGVEAFPLHWPPGWPRAKSRQSSAFQSTLGGARDHLTNELRLMGARYIVLSSNLELRRDGLPYANQKQPTDPGVAVYFQWREKAMALACDRWSKVEDNLRSIGKTVEALRGIERWGASDMMERAFSGFTALPPPSEPRVTCWDVLGVPAGSGKDAVTKAYHQLAKVSHPDKGGSHDQWHVLSKAFNDALTSETSHGRD